MMDLGGCYDLYRFEVFKHQYQGGDSTVTIQAGETPDGFTTFGTPFNIYSSSKPSDWFPSAGERPAQPQSRVRYVKVSVGAGTRITEIRAYGRLTEALVWNPDGQYHFTVTAVDAAGNESDRSKQIGTVTAWIPKVGPNMVWWWIPLIAVGAAGVGTGGYFGLRLLLRRRKEKSTKTA